MIRTASVVSQNDHTVTLKLHQQEKCAGCPSNCNEPLFKLFSMKNNQFDLSLNDSQYAVVDASEKLIQNATPDQLITLKIEDSDLLKSSFVLYLLPLFFGLFGTTLGHYIGQYLKVSSDLSALAGLLLGLMVVVMLFNKKVLKKHLKFMPKVTISIIDGT